VRRLGVTTTRDRAGELADIVTARGCEPVLLPCIEVLSRPNDVVERARDAAAAADRMIVTSPRTISTLWPDDDMPAIPVAVVGARTAKQVEAAGGTVALVAESGADALIARLPEDWWRFNVFFPHGAAAEPINVDGRQIAAMAVYDTRPIPPEADAVDAAIFGSPSAVAGWIMSRSLDDLVLGAIGTSTTDALVQQGHPPDIVPDRPDYEALIALVADDLTDRSPA
jgi:uroporphyrinogen-III synthase